MKFSMAIATLVAANAVAAYEVPNDNTIAKLAAGYEGKKPGSGSIRGSVQELFDLDSPACKAAMEKLEHSNGVKREKEYHKMLKACDIPDGPPDSIRGSVQDFAAMPAACKAAEEADKKLDKCIEPQAKALGLEGELKAYVECGKKALANAETCASGASSQDEKVACLGGMLTDGLACDAKSAEALAPLVAACSEEVGELYEDAGKCFAEIAAGASPSSFMTLMGSFEAKAKAFEAFYGTYSASEDEDESWDEDAVQEFATEKAACNKAGAKAANLERCAETKGLVKEAKAFGKCYDKAFTKFGTSGNFVRLAKGLEACVAPLETACKNEIDHFEKAIEKCIPSFMNEEDEEYEAFYDTYSASEDEDESWDEDEDEEYWDM